MKFLLSVLFILFITEGHAQTLNSKQMSYWNKLLHYRPNLFGKMISEVDSKDFFVSLEGKKSPEKELGQFIVLLNSDKAQEFVCKFPLRYKWLKENIKNDWEFTTKPCTIYNSFVEKLGAKNLSLVFSSFYIKNPGSTFGHTFLRVSRYKEFSTNELLDYAFNFAAEESDDQVFIYMMKGLGGFYKGKFAAAPYYYKIREYSDYEFRDMWDYDLGLNQDQIDWVVDHLWEMGSTYFDYFYFTENCSYHVLGLLNVAYTDIDILKNLNPIFVLPIDTVKEMKKLGLIKTRKVRVSAYEKLKIQTKAFKSKKLEIVKTIATKPDFAKKILKNMSDTEQADILDASILAYDYFNIREIFLNNPKIVNDRETLLVMRAENPVITDEVQLSEKEGEAPDESHGSSRLGLAGGQNNKHNMFSGVSWRAAQHDLLDPHKGQLRNSQVVIFDVDARFKRVSTGSNKFTLNRFRLLDFKKYQPSDYWNSSISWELAVGFDQRQNCQSGDCLNPIVSTAVGNSVDLVEDCVLSLLLGAKYNYDKIYENDSLLSFGPKLNFLILKDQYSLGFDAGYFLPTELFERWLKMRTTYDLEFRLYVRRDAVLFLKTAFIDQETSSTHEGQLGTYFYF